MIRTASAGRLCATILLLSPFVSPIASGALLVPKFDSIFTDANGDICVEASIPPGYRHAVLERYNTTTTSWEPLIAGPLNGAFNLVTFIDNTSGLRSIYRITAGESIQVPAAPLTGAAHFSATYNGATGPILGDELIPHVLNRIAYGPTAADYDALETDGVVSYIDAQLDPTTIDESANAALNDRVADLFYDFVPGTGTRYTGDQSLVTYLKGTAAPPAGWADLNFDDSLWQSTTAPVGYGNDLDYADPLDDMQQDNDAVPPVPGYVSFYTRQEFDIPDPSALASLFLEIQYDDAFVAYVNGVEVARANITTAAGAPPAFDQLSDEVGGSIDDNNAQSRFDLSSIIGDLNTGVNVLAIEIHNASIEFSSDAGVLAELVEYPETAPYTAIRGPEALQQLVHLRGVYSQRQLQAVLAEFWENHFTTDFDKVEDYLLDLEEFEEAAAVSDLAEDQIELQAEVEAARMEWEEYEFFYDNALGYFGDLLLYSASSPPMLIYLDSVLNRAGAPNENYAREILELHTFGVDNGYRQEDIEVLAKCFTGWSVRKVWPVLKPTFPASARTPPTDDSIAYETETTVLDLGPGWKYLKGIAEPTADGMGAPTADWAAVAFDDSAWIDGSTGIGYDDGDDATELTDMEGNYRSVYLRKEFTVNLADGDLFQLEVDFDDGFVAYLNGEELRRRGLVGTPPPFDEDANNHSAAVDGGSLDITDITDKLVQGTNTIAIQVHNAGLDSSDLTMRPRILARTYTAQSINVDNPNGLWTFRFNSDEHNVEAKTLFAHTPAHRIDIPADNTGIDGLDDAIDVVDALASHPSTAEFICIKLVNRFVSDEISLDTYEARTAPDHLLDVVDNAIAAWGSTSPNGHIGTVIRAILDLDNLTGAFWRESSKRAKVKNPVEFINSAFRALDADIADDRLPDRTEDMGMTLFQRDDPDGYDELGLSWADTQSLLERMRFGQGLASNRSYARGAWDINSWLAAYALGTDGEILDHFDRFLFGGTLSAAQRTVILDFMNTDDLGAASTFNSLTGNALINRVEASVGLILATPEFQFQ